MLLENVESITSIQSRESIQSRVSTSASVHPPCVHAENLAPIYKEIRQKNLKGVACFINGCNNNATWFCLNDSCKAPLCGKAANAHHSKHQKDSGHDVQMTSKGRVWCGQCTHEINFDLSEDEREPEEAQPLVLYSSSSNITAQSSVSFQTAKRTPNSALSNRMNYVLVDDEECDDPYRPRGAVGLRNLGNTCYMNAAIQSLSNCPPLREYFRQCYTAPSDFSLNGMPLSKVHPTKPLSSAFRELVTKLWARDQASSLTPTGFVYRIREICAQFRGWSQQDSQEFIRCFLDLLHNELKRPINPREDGFRKRVASPSTNSRAVASASSSRSSSSNGDTGENDHFETADSGLSSDTEDKDEEKKKVVKYRSIISDIFDGELISTVKCLTCQHLSHTRETFQDISLSIPTIEQLELMRESMAELELNNEEQIEEHIRQYQNQNPEGYTQWFFNIAYWILVGPIVSTFAYFYRYFFTGSISLEDCLKAFFSADQLKGEDMYACEKCEKLRNGMKQCKLTRLPEILCVHLKRFRHDNLYHSKVGTRVTFPLCDLDMRPFLDRRLHDLEDLATEYDLVALISHRGSGLDYGHYVAYCRNDLDKCWYEYDDSFVTKVCNEEVMSREAYVLFYQKKAVVSMEQAKEHVKEMLKKPEPRLKDNDRFFISREWLHKFFAFAEPGPISNFDFLCPHGQLSPLLVPKVDDSVTTISARVWDFLHKTCGGGPTLQMLAECHTCRQALIEARNRKQSEKKTFELLQRSNRFATIPPNVISKTWIEKWEEFINDIEREPPPAISNEHLLSTNADGTVRFRAMSNHRTIGYEAWKFLQRIYGGGPEVFYIPYGGNQPTPEQVDEMIHQVEEQEKQHRSKSSHPIVKEPSEDNDGDSPIKKLKISESKEAEV